MMVKVRGSIDKGISYAKVFRDILEFPMIFIWAIYIRCPITVCHRVRLMAQLKLNIIN